MSNGTCVIDHTAERPSRRERDDGFEDDRDNPSNKRHRCGPNSTDINDTSQPLSTPTLSFLASKVGELNMLDGTKGMEIAAVLGRTGVGKTTTIDFCCGARIVRINMSDEDEYGETVLEVDATESEQYLKIGHLGSMTKNIELLSSPRKKKAGQMLFCDMPGSSDDNAIDKVLNCIIRSHALMKARSVCPVLVLKFKDYAANRFQIARSEIEFAASCFNDPESFKQLLVFVTHADESHDDRITLGKLRSQIRNIPQDIPWSVENAAELHSYLVSEFDKAVSRLEKSQKNDSNVRVVRPLLPETREAILDFLEDSYSIDSPSQIFRFNLEADAEKLVNSVINDEQEKICQWLRQTFEYDKVVKAMLEMNQVLKALGKVDRLQATIEQVSQANMSLHNDIIRVVLSLLHSPLDSFDKQIELEPLIARFKDMQIILNSAGELLPVTWKSFSSLIEDYSAELNKYIYLEKEKGSWDALGGCAERMRLLSNALECEQAEKRSASNIMEAIQSRVEEVRKFEVAASVADAMVDLEKACSALTGNFQSEVNRALETCKQFIVDELDKLVQQVENKCRIIENGEGSVSDLDQTLIFSSVTKLYKFTRPEHRIDDFLPPDSRSDSEGGFYRKFLCGLKLDQGSSLERTRVQLLQHYNLLECLLKVEDDELPLKLQLHMDSLKSQIENYIESDHQSLHESYVILFPKERTIKNMICLDSVDGRVLAAKNFSSALIYAAQLLRVDEISRDRICTTRIVKFLELYSSHISELEINIKQGFSSISVIEQCLCAFLAFNHSAIPELVQHFGNDKHGRLRALLERIRHVESQCSNAIMQAKLEECKRIEENSRNESFIFSTAAGLEAYDETLVKLRLLILISGEVADKEDGVQLRDCRSLYRILEQQLSTFLDDQKCIFRSQVESTSRDIDFEKLANAYTNLVPYAKSENFLLVSRDARLMNELTNGMKYAEGGLVQLGEERLEHGDANHLMRNLNRAIRWKCFEGIDSDSTSAGCLKDVRNRLRQEIDQSLQAVDSDLQAGKYEKVASFCKECCDADRDRTLQEAAHYVKIDLKNVQRRAPQICWMDMAQIQAFGSNFERVQQCQDSTLFDFLPEAVREEIKRTCELVQEEVDIYSKKFQQVLDQVIAKNASYSECDNCLKVIIGLREFLPKYFNDALTQFDRHKMQIKAKFDSIGNADDTDLQKLANDVIETMFELVSHGSSHTEIWQVFSNSWHAVRRVLDPQLCKIVQKLRERARVLASQNADLATEMLNTHDKVRNYALQVHCLPSQFPEATEERNMIQNEHVRNIDDFQANLKRGNYSAAVGLYGQLTNERRAQARTCLENHIDDLIKGANMALQGQSQQDRLSRHFEQLQLLKVEFLESKCEQSIISNIECCLKETAETCNVLMDSVCADLEKISSKDVFLPLTEWSSQLERIKKILRFPNEVLNRKKEQILNNILSFGTRARDFAQQQIQDIIDNARILHFHLLDKFLNSMERDSAVLKDMEETMILAGSPLPFRLCDIADDAKHRLVQILDSKKAAAIKLVVAGIADKNELAKLLSTLNQVAKNESFIKPFNDVCSSISSIFDQKAQIAMEAWSNREDGWSDQLNTILYALHIGRDAFQEISTLHRLAEASTEKVLKPMREELDSCERDVISALPQTSGEAARKLLHIRSVAGDVDLMHKYTKDAIKRILSKLQDTYDKDMSFMVKLGDSLAASDSAAGKSIISENPQVFQRVSNMLYNQHMKDKATLDIKQVIKNLEGANAGGALNGGLVESLHARYETKYNELIKKCIKNTTASLPARKRILVQELQQQMQSCPQSDMVELLAVVCALYSFCKSAEHYDSGADDGCIVRPHEIQISSIIRLLSIDSTDPGLLTRMFDIVFKKRRGEQGKIENHFLEIPTGEGKSIVLGIATCIFALKGWHVDCVCYSKYLSARDEKDFRDVFDMLKIVKKDLGKIRYLTFGELCESHIEGIRENVEDLIYGKVKSIDAAGPNEASRVLLIDEADVFFTKRFYGNRHSPGFLLRSPEITALIKFIWDNRRALTDETSILQVPEYNAVVQKFASVEPLIKRSALAMARNVQDLNNPYYAWSFNKDGKLSYLRGGELVPATKFRHQNRTVFAFLGEYENSNPHVTQRDLDDMLGIDIKCGDFSYAAQPIRYYSMMFGVTGTLNTLTSEEKNLLQTEYHITKETVIPSAYGSKRGRLDFSFENQLHVMVLENESEWHARIEKEISESVAVSRPVLVVFKNDRALQNFISARTKFGAAKRLDANLDESDVEYINGIVANATLPGKVSLLTRKFGRGLDFKPSKESNAVGGVMVIQTFFSSAESEQIQIMGRTARQGEKGSYRLIMCSEHLKDKFGFEYSDEGGTGSLALKSALDSARAQKMKGKFDARSKTKLEADTADRKSWEFAKALYGSGTDSEKLSLLNSLDCTPKPMTFVLMLDVSGSMRRFYPALRNAFKTFTDTLIDRGHGSETLLTVIFFDDNARTHVRDTPVSHIHQLAASMPGGGGTSFLAAFALCEKEIRAAHGRDASRAFTVLFLTDGEDSSFNTSKIDQLTRDLGGHIQAYNSIAFGPNASTHLAEVEEAFERAGIKTRSIAPSNAQELVDAFATAASDSGLYMR